MSDAIISDVIAHPLTQTMTRPTSTSWGTYTEVSMVLVEVRTDAGVTGVGETLARFAPKAYADLIETLLKPRLVGQPVSNIAQHWHTMRRSLSGRSGGMLIEAIAGVDIALWDIMGKLAGLPLARLLGGMNRSEIDVYAAAINWVDDDEADAELARLIGRGFTNIKVKMARPVDEACRRIQRMREKAGSEIGLCVDANWAYSLDEAVEVGRALSDNGYFWFEEPLKPEDEDGYERLRERCDVPLAAGESNYSVDQAVVFSPTGPCRYCSQTWHAQAGSPKHAGWPFWPTRMTSPTRLISACPASYAKPPAFISRQPCPISGSWNVSATRAPSRSRLPICGRAVCARKMVVSRFRRGRDWASRSIGTPSNIYAANDLGAAMQLEETK